MAQWIRVEAAALPRHRKTERLMSALGLTRIEATGALVLLWGRALEEAADGCLADWSASDIARAMELAAKDPDLVVDALVDAGFAERAGNHLMLHEWMTYQGNLREAQRKAVWRASKSKDSPESSHSVPGRSRDKTGPSQDSRAGADVTDVTDVRTTPLAEADASTGSLFEPPTGNGKPKADPKAEWLEAFALFYAEYPRKVKPDLARRAWLAVKPWTQENCDAIFAGLERSKAYWSDNDRPRDKIPHPSAFLNSGAWKGEPG